MTSKTPKTTKRESAQPPTLPSAQPLLIDVRQMIVQARASVARAIDSGLTMLYWSLGQRIRQDILDALAISTTRFWRRWSLSSPIYA